MSRLTATLAIAATALACGSCGSFFADIDSTPRITRGDVKRSGVRVTDEQLFASAIMPESPRSWAPGKQWQVADNKIALIFGPLAPDSLAGATLTLQSMQTVPTVSGTDVVELAFASSDGSPLAYRTDLPQSEWTSRASLSIPFAVEMAPVLKADSLMRGNTYYVRTSLWYDARGKAIEGRRHIAVTVDSVTPGTEHLPLKVSFTPKDPSVAPAAVYMTYGEHTMATRNFDKLFSFADPRLSYPNITDANWQLITRSQIAEGMTRDEARLALGIPAQVERGATRGGLQLENWSYGNGVYLLFEDGVLTRYRK